MKLGVELGTTKYECKHRTTRPKNYNWLYVEIEHTYII